MVNTSISSKIKVSIVCFVIAFIVVFSLSLISCSPPLRNITDDQLNAIHGINVTWVDGAVKYGVIAQRIKNYLEDNPNAKVEDLRIIPGVDDMIIDQLKGRFK